MGKKDPLQALTGNGGGTMRKVLGVAIAIALLVVVVKFPSDAAHWAKELWDLGEEVITGLASFIRQAF
ncbi:hypothetical protein [Amycolatopsis sp. FDAARGOS 1241]|uniref:hypothetical protein n=1 Tax=Amycolatopsis sp. FDAARGOS 1241 TaxID=2778070 RepID=UPI00194EF6E6|nr:hypothetical protein [Amycolatopsis sp. FDAARGOS 1241]QRP46906.1 hypothetical protein I6J71_02305 [Amycolatopsis sp. FDAARGOS 1241]